MASQRRGKLNTDPYQLTTSHIWIHIVHTGVLLETF